MLTNTTYYVWTEIMEETFGVTGTMAEIAAAPVASQPPLYTTTDIQYDCTAWSNLDNSIFVPPSQVNFKDVQDSTFEEGRVFEAGEF